MIPPRALESPVLSCAAKSRPVAQPCGAGFPWAAASLAAPNAPIAAAPAPANPAPPSKEAVPAIILESPTLPIGFPFIPKTSLIN